MVGLALEAAEVLEAKGVSVEVRGDKRCVVRRWEKSASKSVSPQLRRLRNRDKFLITSNISSHTSIVGEDCFTSSEGVG